MAEFSSLGLMPELVRGIEALGWALPTAIQAEAMPLILGGGDVLAAAETGAGKTGAFALPLLQLCVEARLGVAQPSVAAAAAAAAAAAVCMLAVGDRDPLVALDARGLLAQVRDDKAWAGVRASHGVKVGAGAGVYYFEATPSDEGLSRVGWAEAGASRVVGLDARSFGYGGTAMKSWNKKFEPYGDKFANGDCVGVLLDARSGEIAFAKNGRLLGVAFTVKPGTLLYPAVSLRNAELTLNFGDDAATPLRFAPASARTVLSAGLPSPALVPAPAPAPAAASSGSTPKLPLALILEPTRELAEQTHRALLDYARFVPPPGLGMALLVGGQTSSQQLDALRRGCDVVTATPGRVIDLVEQGVLNISQVRFFVLDEADALLDAGHVGVITKLYDRMPKVVARTNAPGATDLQVLMFSATLHSRDVYELSLRICRFPQRVDLEGLDAVPALVDHFVLDVAPRRGASGGASSSADEDDALVQLAAAHVVPPLVRYRTDGVHAGGGGGGGGDGGGENARESDSESVKQRKALLVAELIAAFKMQQCLLFCRTRLDCESLEAYLSLRYPQRVASLHGGLSNNERRDNLRGFVEGRYHFLLCTDVAARGIDVKGLPFVINVSLPSEAVEYIHRVGRVGRAGTRGIALSLVATCDERAWFHRCRSKGANCGDRRACTVWLSERSVLEAIERHLDYALTRIDAHLLAQCVATVGDAPARFVASLPTGVVCVAGEEAAGGAGGGGGGGGGADGGARRRRRRDGDGFEWPGGDDDTAAMGDGGGGVMPIRAKFDSLKTAVVELATLESTVQRSYNLMREARAWAVA